MRMARPYAVLAVCAALSAGFFFGSIVHAPASGAEIATAGQAWSLVEKKDAKEVEASSATSASESSRSDNSESPESGSESGRERLNTETRGTTRIQSAVSTPTVQTAAQADVSSVQPNEAARRILKEETKHTPSGQSSAGTDTAPSVDTELRSQPKPLPQQKPPAQIESDGTDTAPSVDTELRSQPKPLPTQIPPAQLENVGASIRHFSREARLIETKVDSAVTHEVKKALDKAHRTDDADISPEQIEERARFSKLLDDRKEALADDVHTAVASSVSDAQTLTAFEPILKSSLQDIEFLIETETGVDVDLSPGARSLSSAVKERAVQLTTARQEILSRGGLDLYTDSDKDGVSNYDEKHIYRTDSFNAYTAGSSLTDGERILLGFSARATSTERVAVESPKTAGEAIEGVFEVYTITVGTQVVASSSPEDAGAGVSGTTTAQTPYKKELITFSGRALPHSFITLYIFSAPVIVTIKTDASGAWAYTLDSELEDGSHELYVATVDDGGRILAKSPVIPFVKFAEAAEFTPLIIPTTAEVDPIDVLRNNVLLLSGLALSLFALIALAILGMRRGRLNQTGSVT